MAESSRMLPFSSSRFPYGHSCAFIFTMFSSTLTLYTICETIKIAVLGFSLSKNYAHTNPSMRCRYHPELAYKAAKMVQLPSSSDQPARSAHPVQLDLLITLQIHWVYLILGRDAHLMIPYVHSRLTTYLATQQPYVTR